MRVGRRGSVGVVVGVLAALVFCAALPVGASGAPGDVAYAGCVATDGAHGCVDPPIESIDAVRGLALSPDGRSVYTTAFTDPAITNFARAADGAPVFGSCLAYSLSGSACAPVPNQTFFHPYGLTVSPDNEDVYAVSESDSSINHFVRGGDGSLAFGGCVANNGQDGCTDPTTDSLDDANAVAVSPDGLSVYVTSGAPSGGGDDAVTHFSRNGAGGVTFVGCTAHNGQAGCVDPPQDALDAPSDVVVSPDGEDVYVAGNLSDAINHFTRAPNGSLVFSGCIANGGAGGCTDPPVDSINGINGISISPDGASVYAASVEGGSVTHFTRAANGTLAFAGCVADDGLNGCADPAQDALFFSSDVAVSPDGQSVYVISQGDVALNNFDRAADGSLTFDGCIANAGGSGCTDPAQDALGGPTRVEVSHDGRSVYIAATGADALVHFTREPAADEPAADTTPPETTISKGPKKKVKTKKRKAKVKFTLASTEPGSTFTCRLDKKAFKACGSTVKLKAKKGKRRFEAVATDAAGNADPTPARYSFKVKRKR